MTAASAAPLHPRDAARVLSEIATLLELNGGDVFRARAFANAARVLEGTDADLAALARAGRLTELRGVGEGLAAVLEELVLTGRSEVHEELRTATPIGLFEVMRIPGLGVKRIRTLYQELGIDSLDALEAAARAGQVATLPGFGAKTEAKILEGIAFARQSRGRRRYPEALEVAARLCDWLGGQEGVQAVEIAGAVRRRLEVVDEVVLVAATDDPDRVATAVLTLNGVEAGEWEAQGGLLRARLPDGLPLRLRLTPPAGFVAAVVWETGSDAHLQQLAARATAGGAALSAAGLQRSGEPVELADEEALYTALGLAYLAPELREGLGEVELAASGSPPRLVELDDLRGTFHCHTTFSDGKATVTEMAEAARELGWSYLGLGDHSRTAAYAGGMTVAEVRRQHREIDRFNAASEGFRLFKGVESDILPDGSLDYSDAVLASFDYVVGSVHSSFGMPQGEMTERIIRAVRHPALTVLGHPTGRLLLSREGYAVDLRAVIDAAAEAGVVIEINANPHRLDLDWREVRYAAGRGVTIAINPDAHSTAGLAHVAYGVNMARKAGLGPEQILNCWTLDQVERFFAERKQAGQAG